MSVRVNLACLALIVMASASCGSSTTEETDGAQREFWARKESRDRLDAFVAANAKFTLIHEFAHHVIDEYKLPVLGRHEDAADNLAAYLMAPSDAGTRPEDEVTTSAKAADLAWVAYYWTRLGRSGVQERSKLAWHSEHGIDEQRGYNVLCLLYGSNPKRFELLANEYSLPTHRRASCVRDAGDNARSWEASLGPYLLSDPEREKARRTFFDPANQLVKSQSPGTTYADYEAPELWQNVPWFPWNSRSFLQRHTLLEDLVDTALMFRSSPGRTIPLMTATSCEGLENAYYDPRDRVINICYPLVNQFARLGRELLWTSELAKTR